MPEPKSLLLLFLLSITFYLAACQSASPEISEPLKPLLPETIALLPESTVQEIPLLGQVSEAHAEISGMAWCGEHLILLPQYPGRFNIESVDHVFSIPQIEIDAFLSGENQNGIEPERIPFNSGGVESLVPGFEGFESIVFNGKVFYITIEARENDAMMGYIGTGQVIADCETLVLNPESLQELKPQADIKNMSHETLVYFEDHIYAIYEANGLNVNPSAVVHVFDHDLGVRSEIPVDNIEYRITDAAVADETGAFWAVNYFFPGDAGDLVPAVDQLALDYGVGVSHQNADPVERLVKFRIDDEGVQLVDQAPIYLELLVDDSRNWEGIVQYGEGFLLVTDKFPTTILVYAEAVN